MGMKLCGFDFANPDLAIHEAADSEFGPILSANKGLPAAGNRWDKPDPQMA
jgi:hypothetical protein